MRLFVALDPSQEAADHLAAALPAIDGVRATARATWHVTLVFCGEVGASTADCLALGLHDLARQSEPVELRLHGAGSFGTALWVGVSGALAGLQRAVAQAVRSCGVPVEERPFRPHLTVGRSRGTRAPVDALASYAGPPWTATELRLVRSHLGPPVRHETVGEWPLGAG